jgi:hypothetical protein
MFRYGLGADIAESDSSSPNSRSHWGPLNSTSRYRWTPRRRRNDAGSIGQHSYNTSAHTHTRSTHIRTPKAHTFAHYVARPRYTCHPHAKRHTYSHTRGTFSPRPHIRHSATNAATRSRTRLEPSTDGKRRTSGRCHHTFAAHRPTSERTRQRHAHTHARHDTGAHETHAGHMPRTGTDIAHTNTMTRPRHNTDTTGHDARTHTHARHDTRALETHT